MKKLNTGLSQLVTILNDGQYHDGTTIGQQLGITRSAIWKMIKKLNSYGIKIDSVKSKGYALLEPLILLNKKIIQQGIQAKNIDLHLFETLNSTNDYLKTLPKKNHAITLCLAEQQTQGKGRLQREWFSPFGQNIYFSCAYYLQKDISTLGGLSLIIALAVAKTLETYALPHIPMVKWPNDVLYDGKKISGNLIEIQAESNGACHAIIGIGININLLPDAVTPITQAWASLRNAAGCYIDRNQFCIILINQLIHHLTLFEQQGLMAFMNDWHTTDHLFNKLIILNVGKQKVTGKAKGIDPQGHLILQLPEGQLQHFSSGDTSIVKQ